MRKLWGRGWVSGASAGAAGLVVRMSATRAQCASSWNVDDGVGHEREFVGAGTALARPGRQGKDDGRNL